MLIMANKPVPPVRFIGIKLNKGGRIFMQRHNVSFLL